MTINYRMNSMALGKYMQEEGLYPVILLYKRLHTGEKPIPQPVSTLSGKLNNINS